jgi:hypothetical protein
MGQTMLQRAGKTDRERRENYRGAVAGRVESIPADPRWWRSASASRRQVGRVSEFSWLTHEVGIGSEPDGLYLQQLGGANERNQP